MAILNYGSQEFPPYEPLKFETEDIAIGGKMVVGMATMTESYRLMMEDGDKESIKAVKNQLIHQMAEYMLENNLVEFTYRDDPISFSRMIAVRAYLAPNDQVKIIRSVIKV